MAKLSGHIVRVKFVFYTESVFLFSVKIQAPVSDSVYELDMNNCVAAIGLCVFAVRSSQVCALFAQQRFNSILGGKFYG